MISFRHINKLLIDESLWSDEAFEDLVNLAFAYHMNVYLVPDDKIMDKDFDDSFIKQYPLWDEPFKQAKGILYVYQKDGNVMIKDQVYPSLYAAICAKQAYDRCVMRRVMLLTAVMISLCAISHVCQWMIFFAVCVCLVLVCCIIPQLMGVKGGGEKDDFISMILDMFFDGIG